MALPRVRREDLAVEQEATPGDEEASGRPIRPMRQVRDALERYFYPCSSGTGKHNKIKNI